MQNIRRALAAQELPAACRSTSCPVFRGDDLHYTKRRQEENTSGDSSYEKQRLALRSTSLSLGTRAEPDEGIAFQLTIDSGKHAIKTDLFIAIRDPSGKLTFLPDWDSFAIPFQTSLDLEPSQPLFVSERISRSNLTSVGSYSISAALFVANSNPNVAANCIWSRTISFVIGANPSSPIIESPVNKFVS